MLAPVPASRAASPDSAKSISSNPRALRAKDRIMQLEQPATTATQRISCRCRFKREKPSPLALWFQVLLQSITTPVNVSE